MKMMISECFLPFGDHKRPICREAHGPPQTNGLPVGVAKRLWLRFADTGKLVGEEKD